MYRLWPTLYWSAILDAAMFELWHNRLGHAGKYVVTNAYKYVDGAPPVQGNVFYRCASCMKNKAILSNSCMQ